MAQTKRHGVKRIERMFVFKAAAYNLIRLPRDEAARSLSSAASSPWGKREKSLNIAPETANRISTLPKSDPDWAFSAAR
jgi:hypothetical protein